jgi:predicted RNase H-like HicB family nuclease
MKVVYPACFYPNGNGYTVVVPDLKGCVTEGDSLSEAIDMTQDAIGGWLSEFIEESKPIPKHSDIKNVITDEYEDGFVTLIMVDMDE